MQLLQSINFILLTIASEIERTVPSFSSSGVKTQSLGNSLMEPCHFINEREERPRSGIGELRLEL